MSDLDPTAIPQPVRDITEPTIGAGAIRRAVDEALAGARLELIAAEGRAAARRAETAGAKYSSRPLDAQGRDSLGEERAPQPLVGVLGQTFRDLGDSELYVVRRDEELLRVLASALPGHQLWAGASPPTGAAWDATAEIPIGAEDSSDDCVNPARESPWHRAAIMVGLALLTFVGVIAFLVAP